MDYLVDDLLLFVAQRLDVKSAVALSLVNQRHLSLLSDAEFWRQKGSEFPWSPSEAEFCKKDLLRFAKVKENILKRKFCVSEFNFPAAIYCFYNRTITNPSGTYDVNGNLLSKNDSPNSSTLNVGRSLKIFCCPNLKQATFTSMTTQITFTNGTTRTFPLGNRQLLFGEHLVMSSYPRAIIYSVRSGNRVLEDVAAYTGRSWVQAGTTVEGLIFMDWSPESTSWKIVPWNTLQELDPKKYCFNFQDEEESERVVDSLVRPFTNL
jgi:hypothetical protein